MKNNKPSGKVSETFINEIFAFINVLKIVSKTSKFRKWLKEYHKIENDKDVFEGYKFFSLTSLRNFIYSITYDKILKLSEDDIFYRANYVGVPLDDIPNTCEKIIFIKNVWKLSIKIYTSKNWNELQRNLKELRNLFEIFDKLYKNVTPITNINKKQALKTVTKFYTFIYLHDTREGYPFIWGILPMLTYPKINEKYFTKSFKGYIYSLQYLWFNLLERNEFENSVIKNLHTLTFSEDRSSKEDISEQWRNLYTSFFNKIADEIIEPIEKNLGIMRIDPLLTIKKIDKSVYKNFLSKKNIKDPRYLTCNDKESIKKRLDYHLLWYEKEVLGTQTFGMFYGFPTFTSILIGLVELNKHHRSDKKILVKIFKHPTEDKKVFDYSFAILLQSTQFVADYCGWLIFFDCGTYSPNSNFWSSKWWLYIEAEEFIKKFKKENLIETEEILVDKQVFEEYLTSAQKRSQKIQTNFISIVKGKFFEYVVYKWRNEKSPNSDVRCDVQLNGEQIDCIEEEEGGINLFECKLNLHIDEIDDVIQQIKRKEEVVKDKYKKMVIPWMIVYSPVDPYQKSKIESKGIMVFDDFKSEIKTNKLFNGSRKIILDILDFEEIYY